MNNYFARRSVIVSAALLLAACATPNREGATTFAAQGVQVATALNTEAVAAASEIRSLPDRVVISTVMNVCRIKEAKTETACEKLTEGDIVGNIYADAAKLADLLDQRARAFVALRDAYDAFAKEGDYDAATDLKGAVGSLVEEVGKFAGTAGALLGAQGPSESATAAVKAAATLLAGAWADRQQIVRLDEANEKIAEAVDTLRAGLAAEREYQATLRGLVGTETWALIDELIRAKLISGYAAAMRSAWPSGASAFPDSSESAIRENVGAKVALHRMMKARALQSFDVAERNYASLLMSLDQLAAAHREFKAENQPSIAQFALVMSQIAVAIDQWAKLREAEEAAAAASAKPKPEKPKPEDAKPQQP